MNKRLLEALTQMVRPNTSPVAVKVQEGGEDLPPRAVFPFQNFKNRLALCQGFSLARRMGMTVVFGPQDHQCPIVLMALGIKEVSERFKEGVTAHPFYAETPEIGAALNASHLLTLPRSDDRHVIIAPLERAAFTPDVILVYGNSAQIHRLIMAANYKTGRPVTAVLTERMGCVRALIGAMQSGEYQVAIPGSGERAFGLCGEDELIFAVPQKRVEELVSGLEGTQKAGGMRYPNICPALMNKPAFPAAFGPLMEELGLEK